MEVKFDGNDDFKSLLNVSHFLGRFEKIISTGPQRSPQSVHPL